MKALILSAGFGTRLRPYSNQTPKPMFTLAGRPLLDWHIRSLETLQCSAVAVNTHHLHEAIEDFVSSQNYSIPVHMCHEPDLLGTGGAIKNLSDFWDDGPFFVINSDIFHEFDLTAVYRFHCGHHHPATLVLWDDENFNSVLIDGKNFVQSFRREGAVESSTENRYRTFTGIQVLDTTILDYIPKGKAYHSIDAFRSMMAAGHAIKAYLPGNGSWSDLGTPERYRRMARKMTARSGFAAAYGNIKIKDIKFERLAGDGSERRWYRLRSDERTLILCDHGLKDSAEVSEADSFVNIGNHLKGHNLPVPQIHFHDCFAGLVLLEDLGDRHLQKAVLQSGNEKDIRRWYRQIITDLVDMSLEGIKGFNPDWAYQTPEYDRDLILEKECRYFVEAFLQGVLNLTVEFDQLLPEFEFLASNALTHALIGFMHRDLQSRNIMVIGDRLYLIDFQAGRRGPLQYDLASLLVDPYVELTETLQADLFDYALHLVKNRCKTDPDGFRHSYEYCRLSRNLQMLGAFGFLTRVKGKKFFEPYIKPAVHSLKRHLSVLPDSEFQQLRSIVTGQVLPRFK